MGSAFMTCITSTLNFLSFFSFCVWRWPLVRFFWGWSAGRVIASSPQALY